MPSAEMLRADARRLIAMARNHADPQLQRELAAQALELSEIAEAIERTVEDREIIEANIIRYRSLLTGETSHETRKIVEGLLAEAEKILAFLTRKDTVPESPAEKRSSWK
jgi:hypothetical protein